MTEPTLYPQSSETRSGAAGYKLRVLSGALQGREFELMPGSWIIGGPDADLAVVLEGNASATLDIDASGVRLRGELKCWLRGKAYAPDGLLPLEVPLDLAGFHIVLGPLDANLDAVEAVDRRVPIQRLGSGSLVAALVISGVALGAVFMFIPRSQQIDMAQQRANWITHIEHELADDRIRVKSTEDGVLELSGACTDAVGLDKIRAELRAHQVTFTDNVVCSSDVVREITDTLGLYGYYNATVRPTSTPGSYEIVGPIKNDAAWGTVEEQLRQLPGVSSWTVHDALGPFSSQVVSAIRQAGLGPYVTVFPSGQGISISGQLSEDRQAMLDQLIRNLRSRADSSVSIQYDNISTDNVANKVLDAPIVTYIGNATSPSVQLANGTVLRNGSITSKGYTVSQLDTNGIDLIRDGRVTHLPSAIIETSGGENYGRANGLKQGTGRSGVLDLP